MFTVIHLDNMACMQAQLIVGKVAHVVMRLKTKRSAMTKRLALFLQLLKSYIPDLKEVNVHQVYISCFHVVSVFFFLFGVTRRSSCWHNGILC